MKTLILLTLSFTLTFGYAQRKKAETQTSKSQLEQLTLSGLKFRNVGPAITSGRISDFAVNPDNPKEYYVATSAGGVWKTVNGGVIYTPIFDAQGSYSIGVVTMDPNNSNVIWVGTGENNNQRSVAYGDGIYKSNDGGATWEHMGLKNSEHIGSIVVDPENSNRIYVAAIGPLWSAGGDRGAYVSEDGGKTWTKTLSIDAHTGVNEIVIHPEDPNVLYASALQRRRHVFTYIGGGPGSSIYKSTDKGKTWEKVNKGLPEVDLGRIGLAFAPSKPDILYAIVEAAQGEGGFYRTVNAGASWEKISKYATSGNYYQEIAVDPNDPMVIYAMDTWMHISVDGGKTFNVLGEVTKHVDNHCIWIDPQDSQHLLVGCDGGIYETFDRAATWEFKPNLPVTQFYKVAVDYDEPFYNIYGGTQDNFSMGGPSRTVSGNGIVNSDWYMTHGGDGFESQIDPTNPDIIYAQSQYGYLVRYDRKSGEEVGIKPQPAEGENQFRWNWDAPLHISSHSPTRIYFSANKVFKSDNRGNSWTTISGDLSRNLNRNKLPVMDRVWSIDAVMKNQSTSPYGTLVAFHESPINENLLIVGSDDGLIHITTDGGGSWKTIDNLPGAPARSYVNSVLTSNHDENVMYAAFNHHKYGDFKPYLFKTTDKGQSWTKISNNLPERGSVYTIAEDHKDPNLVFVGTEFGVFFSPNGGAEWKQLKSGVPTIAVRDLAIQEREDDLVLGTFGRGFYVLDDYSPLRTLSSTMSQDAALLELRDPWVYVESLPLGIPGKGFQGDNYYTGENLPPVALFSYYLKEAPKSNEDLRRDQEKENIKAGKNNNYPTYDRLKSELLEEKPYLLFTITDDEGNVVRKLTSEPKKGLNRLQWDLRYATDEPINLTPPAFYNPWGLESPGNLVAPGSYTVAMSVYNDGEFKKLGEPVSYEVKALNNAVLPAPDRNAKLAFQREVAAAYLRLQAAQKSVSEIKDRIRFLEEAVLKAEIPQEALYTDLIELKLKVTDLGYDLNGDPIASQLDMDMEPSVSDRLGMVMGEQLNTTSKPTETHIKGLEIALKQLKPLEEALKALIADDLTRIEKVLDENGAPYTPNRGN